MYNFNSIYGNNPYYNNYIPQQYQQPINQNYRIVGLQGKVIDNIDVVKGMDIPMDGSISYYPLADGSAIVSKQLQQDGTSKIVIYKPSNDTEETNQKYITESELNDKMSHFNNKDIKDIKEDIKSLKRQIEDITDDLDEKRKK